MPLPDELLVTLLESQGYRELVSAHLFATGVSLAPTIDDKHMLADHAREELGHFEVVAAVYEQLAGRSLHDVVAARARQVPSPATWLEAAVAGYLVDRAAAVQLGRYGRLDDARLAPVVQQILEHEHEHLSAAETALLDQCRGKADVAAAVAEHVTRWLPIARSVLDTTGPASERTAETLLEMIRPTLRACGVPVPS